MTTSLVQSHNLPVLWLICSLGQSPYWSPYFLSWPLRSIPQPNNKGNPVTTWLNHTISLLKTKKWLPILLKNLKDENKKPKVLAMPAGTPCRGPLLSLFSSLTSSSPVHSSLVPPPLLLFLEHIKPVPATGSLHLMVLPPGLLGFIPSFYLVISQLQPHWEDFSSCYLKCHSPTPVTFCPFFSLAFLCSTYDHLIYYIYLFTSEHDSISFDMLAAISPVTSSP